MIALLVCLAVVAFAIVVLLVARASYAKQAAHAREHATPEPKRIHRPLLLSFASLIVVGPAGVALLELLPPIQSLFADLACPVGWTIIATSSTEGASTYYGVMCSNGHEWRDLSSVFLLACAAFVAALTSLTGLFLSGRRWLAERQRRKWAIASE